MLMITLRVNVIAKLPGTPSAALFNIVYVNLQNKVNTKKEFFAPRDLTLYVFFFSQIRIVLSLWKKLWNVS